VHAWEERFVPLAFALTPVQPSPQIWPQIERRIAADPALAPVRETRRSALRRIAAIFALVAVVAGGYGIWRTVQRSNYQLFAMIAMPNGTMAWKLEMDSVNERMRMSVMPGAPWQPDRSFELWALPDSGALPVSLGLLPQSGRQEHALSQAQRQAIGAASRVAVSMEPPRGSPTGAPTGPVLFVTDRIKQV
jgi:anti-sigma-K factor RskA